MMIIRPFTLVTCLLFTSPAAVATPAGTELDQARAAIADLSSALKTELVAAMQSGGPLEAIEVCSQRAPEIARRVSADRNVSVYRLSLRNRNPDNAPSEWEAEVLREFEKRRIAGENPSSMDWRETTEREADREFRYMKAIPTAALCLQCHGEKLALEVANKLKERYPGDQATGFQAGDIRGAFVVTLPIRQ